MIEISLKALYLLLNIFLVVTVALFLNIPSLKPIWLYMNKKMFTPFILLCLLTGYACKAQAPNRPVRKVYISTDFDIFLLSTSIIQKTGTDTRLSPLRFTAIPFLGLNVNFDFGTHTGLYTGLNVKNIGFIEKFSNPDSTVKRRVYTIGAPLGLKIGNIKYGSYLIVGIGADLPFHYKEKGFTDRGNKTKFSEWFSDRTIKVMPYGFIGAHLAPVLTVKFQYYPSNFLNQGYKTRNAAGQEVRPYANYYVPTLMFTAGIDIPFAPKN